MGVNKYKVVAIGNMATCSFCKKFNQVTGNGALQARLTNAEFFWADQAKSLTEFAEWMKKASASGAAPVIAVFDASDKLLGKFVGRSTVVSPFTVDGIVSKIESICADCTLSSAGSSGCTIGGGCTCCSCGAKIKYCPSCGEAL